MSTVVVYDLFARHYVSVSAVQVRGDVEERGVRSGTAACPRGSCRR